MMIGLEFGCIVFGIFMILVGAVLMVIMRDEKELFLFSLGLFLTAVVVELGMYTAYQDGHNSVTRWCDFDLVPGVVYRVYGEPAEWVNDEPLGGEIVPVTRYLTWLQAESDKYPISYALQKKLTSKEVVVFRNDNGEIEYLERAPQK